MRKIKERTTDLGVKQLDAASRLRMVSEFVTAENRLILLDYDGTLVPFASKPHMASPDNELLTTNLDIHVLPGNKTIEVRTTGISKGAFFRQFFAAATFSFIFAAGDDWTDEDLFAVLPAEAYSIKVGMQMSKARYNVSAHPNVRSLLNQLTEAADARN